MESCVLPFKIENFSIIAPVFIIKRHLHRQRIKICSRILRTQKL